MAQQFAPIFTEDDLVAMDRHAMYMKLSIEGYIKNGEHDNIVDLWNKLVSVSWEDIQFFERIERMLVEAKQRELAASLLKTLLHKYRDEENPALLYTVVLEGEAIQNTLKKTSTQFAGREPDLLAVSSELGLNTTKYQEAVDTMEAIVEEDRRAQQQRTLARARSGTKSKSARPCCAQRAPSDPNCLHAAPDRRRFAPWRGLAAVAPRYTRMAAPWDTDRTRTDSASECSDRCADR